MGTISFNMNKLVSNGINRPSKNGEPLYLRKDDEGSNLKVYSSPTNLRRVAITRDKIGIRTWIEPAGMSGSKVLAYSSNIEGFSDGSGFDELKSLIDTEEQRKQEYLAMCASEGHKDVEKPDEVNISGNGLKALLTPYVCSNVERIVFDELILLANENRDFLRNPNALFNPKNMQIFLAKCLGVNPNEILKRLPLLKEVFFIPGYYRISETVPVEALLSDKFNEEQAKAISENGNIPIMCVKFNGNRERLDIREGIYVFDDKLRRIKLSSKKEEVDISSNEEPVQEEEETEVDDRLDSVAKIIEKTIRNSIEHAESEQEQNARILFFGEALLGQYGRETTEKMVDRFSNELIKSKILQR